MSEKNLIAEIGENAGLVWNFLSDGSSKSTKEIKKVTKLNDKEIYLAIGWLAREGKVTLQDDGANFYVSLV